MPDYTVKQGDCLSSIAYQFGFPDPKKIWDLPQNEAIRKKRASFNVLHPGDVIFIPERKDKKEALTPGKKQNVQVTLVKKKLHLVLYDAKTQPLANADYKLEVGGKVLTGKTDGNGGLDQEIPGDATNATLTVGKLAWSLAIGHLNPVEHTPDDGLSGIQARLKNLGLLVDEVEGFFCDNTRKAVKAFQRWFDMEVTGTLSEDFRKMLEKVHRHEKKPSAQSSGGGGALQVEVKDSLPDVPDLCASLPKKKDQDEKKPVNSIAADIVNVLKPPRKGTCSKCKSFEDCLDNDYNFLLAVAQMAEKLGGDASNFMGIMHFETGHGFSPKIKNPTSGATGLIQFYPSTATGLGTTVDALAEMCRIEQLDWVSKYFENVQSQYPNADFTELADVVLAVFEPVGLKHDSDVIGVDEAKCTGPFVDVDGKDVEWDDGLLKYYKENGNLAKDHGVIKDDKGAVIGLSEVKARPKYFRAEYKGKKIKVTPHMQAVYRDNSGVDANQDGFISRDEYPGIIENQIVKKCGKASCAKASDLQKQAGSLKFIICRPSKKS